MRIWALLLMLTTTAHAGPWGLDVGLLAGVGPGGYVGQPAGLAPSGPLFLMNPPKVEASSPLGLLGSVGADFSVHYKRRWTLSLQPQWQGRSLVMDQKTEVLNVSFLTQTAWEWQAVSFPLSLQHSYPVFRAPGMAVLLRGGAGLWYSSVQARRKTFRQEVGDPKEMRWDGPPDDWGPLLALGVDWLNLPKGSKALGLELRFESGTARQDPGAGAGLPVWGVQGVLVVPVAMILL